jgi:hypothetical protein
MLGSRSHLKPTFLWQGVLILFPVALMSVIGLVAIVRDKTTIEQEARQRASDLVGQLGFGLSQRVPAELAAYDLFSDTWLQHHWELAAGTRRPADDDYTTLLAAWQAANPSLSPVEVLPNRLGFTPEGGLIWPADYAEPPQAPPWFVGLTEHQRQAWDAVLQAESTVAAITNMEVKVEEFLKTDSPPEARANAEFIWLRTSLAGQSGLEVMQALDRCSDDYRHLHSAAGLPLLSLIGAEALRAVRQSGRAQSLFLMDPNDRGGYLGDILSWLLDEPSLLTPVLMAQLESLVDAHTIEAARFEPRIRAARAVWSAQERLHEIGETIRRHEFLRGFTGTNFWLPAASGLWFCRSSRGEITLLDRDSDRVIHKTTNEVNCLRCYPKQMIERAVAGVVQDLGAALPDYMTVNVQVENLVYRRSKRCLSARRPGGSTGALTIPLSII